MVHIDISTLVNDWISYSSLNMEDEEAKQYEWAMFELMDIVFENPKRAWDITLEIVSRSDNEGVLIAASVGPLENMLHTHTDPILSWIRKEASGNPKFRGILEYIWQDVIPDEEWDKICVGSEE